MWISDRIARHLKLGIIWNIDMSLVRKTGDGNA